MNTLPNLGPAAPAAPPLYPAAVYQLPDLAALEEIAAGGPGFIYARDQHPNAAMLEAELARLDGAAWAVVTGSGMAALSLACLASLNPGDRLLVAEHLYGRTLQLTREEWARLGVVVEQVNCQDLAAISATLGDNSKPQAKLLLVETITNPLMQVSPLPELAQCCQKHDCRLLVDNTFATPALCQPLRLGATWTMQSLTKFVAGHSDVTLGMLAGSDASLPRLRHLRSVWGLMGSPLDCWLCQRGLATLELRLRAACKNAERLSDWLRRHPAVARVYYPAAAERVRLATDLGGWMLSCELAGGKAAVECFLRAGTIPFLPSLGDVRTSASYPSGTSHRYVPEAEKQRLGITEGLLRLSVGIEPWSDVERKMQAALSGP